MQNFLNEGGVFMYIILGISVIALAFIMERFFALNFQYRYRESFFQKIVKKVKSNQITEAIKMCKSTSHPLAEVLLNTLKNAGREIEAIESSANITIAKVIPKIQRRTGYIQMIGNIATLIGLLGTIQGLIQSFSSLATADASEKAAQLASGISAAMNTTAFGLMVAIPCIICFTILTNKENDTLQKYDETVSEVIYLIAYKNKEDEVEAA